MIKDGVRSGFHRPATYDDDAASPPAKEPASDQTESPTPQKPNLEERIWNAFTWLHERAILDAIFVVSLFVFLVWYSYREMGGV